MESLAVSSAINSTIIKPRKGEPRWLTEKRQAAFEAFLRLPFPEKIHDLEIKSDMKKLDAHFPHFVFNAMNMHDENAFSDYSVTDSSTTDSSDLFFENPELEQLKKQGLVIETFDVALKKHEDIIKRHLYSKSFSQDKLLSLNSAFWQRGIFIYVPENMEVKTPLRLNFACSTGIQLDRILVVADANSKISLLESLEDKEDKNFGEDKDAHKNQKDSFRIEAVEVFLREGSSVFFGSVQNFSENFYNFSFKKADVVKDAFLTWTDCCFGGDLTVSEVLTDLIGQGAKACNWGIFFGTKKQRFGIFLKNNHLSGHTISDMLTKGVLSEESHSVYNGTVKIAEKASGSNGYQRQDVLLLSNKAGADAKPNLEIDNNDVRCTHGVTIGQIDKEKLFYLMSRGLGAKPAKNIIVRGFFETLLRRIPVLEMQSQMEHFIDKHL